MLLHQKPFTLPLSFENGRFMLVYYNHGIPLNRTWSGYKKLMRKWQFFKNPAVYQGIANRNAPALHCLVWYKGNLWPVKHIVQLQIQEVRFEQVKVEAGIDFDFLKQHCNPINPGDFKYQLTFNGQTLQEFNYKPASLYLKLNDEPQLNPIV